MFANPRLALPGRLAAGLVWIEIDGPGLARLYILFYPAIHVSKRSPLTAGASTDLAPFEEALRPSLLLPRLLGPSRCQASRWSRLV